MDDDCESCYFFLLVPRAYSDLSVSVVLPDTAGLNMTGLMILSAAKIADSTHQIATPRNSCRCTHLMQGFLLKDRSGNTSFSYRNEPHFNFVVQWIDVGTRQSLERIRTMTLVPAKAARKPSSTLSDRILPLIKCTRNFIGSGEAQLFRTTASCSSARVQS
jgi:hypothetical protein